MLLANSKTRCSHQERKKHFLRTKRPRCAIYKNRFAHSNLHQWINCGCLTRLVNHSRCTRVATGCRPQYWPGKFTHENSKQDLAGPSKKWLLSCDRIKLGRSWKNHEKPIGLNLLDDCLKKLMFTNRSESGSFFFLAGHPQEFVILHMKLYEPSSFGVPDFAPCPVWVKLKRHVATATIKLTG